MSAEIFVSVPLPPGDDASTQAPKGNGIVALAPGERYATSDLTTLRAEVEKLLADDARIRADGGTGFLNSGLTSPKAT